MSLLFAATYPHRVQALVCSGGMARSTCGRRLPVGDAGGGPARVGRRADRAPLGRGRDHRGGARPARPTIRRARAFLGPAGARAAPAPGCSRRSSQMFFDLDVRDVVPSVHVPTLVLHRRRDRLVNVGNGRWLAEHLPNARLVELPRRRPHHLVRGRRADARRDAGVPHRRSPRAPSRSGRSRRSCSRTSSTPRARRRSSATSAGGTCWRGTSGPCATRSRRFDGREVKSTGDGFPGHVRRPGRAIRCARAILDSSEPLGIRVRAGLHTGECEVMGDDIGGIAVHIAARVSAHAGPARCSSPAP